MNGNEPIVLTGLDWERLPSGEFGLVVDCLTGEDFEALPKWLMVKGERFVRFRWYPDLQRAAYQNWDRELALIKELM